MIRVLAKGKAGTVTLEDGRDDGSHVLLQCEELQTVADGGVLVSPKDDGEYPMPLLYVENTKQVANDLDREAFTLKIDISEMPRGLIRFQIREFIAHVVQLVVAGEDQAQIAPANAKEWGLIEDKAVAS